MDITNDKRIIDKFISLRGREDLKHLYKDLTSISDSYTDFVYGILDYASYKESRIKMIASFIESHNNITTSDLIEFVALQPDFMDDSLYENHQAVASGR